METQVKDKFRSAGIRAMYREILENLRKTCKQLPSKYFYDETGSALFDEITQLDEYYVTRTETLIMKDNIHEIAAIIGNNAMLIEYGSGSSEKTRILLDNVSAIKVYVPIDISCAHLAKSAEEIAANYRSVEVKPVCADYSKFFKLPVPDKTIEHRVVYFPGSTIGNFHPPEALDFLKRIHAICSQNGGLLIGVDLKKDTQTLNNAYNDVQGVTAEFNLNQLKRINRELDADFDLDNFEHNAFYNEKAGRVEMHIVSKASQVVHLNGDKIHFRQGESIWTESSYKYTVEEFADLAGQAGLKLERVWTDKNHLFSIQFFTTV